MLLQKVAEYFAIVPIKYNHITNSYYYVNSLCYWIIFKFIFLQMIFMVREYIIIISSDPFVNYKLRVHFITSILKWATTSIWILYDLINCIGLIFKRQKFCSIMNSIIVLERLLLLNQQAANIVIERKKILLKHFKIILCYISFHYLFITIHHAWACDFKFTVFLGLTFVFYNLHTLLFFIDCFYITDILNRLIICVTTTNLILLNECKRPSKKTKTLINILSTVQSIVHRLGKLQQSQNVSRLLVAMVVLPCIFYVVHDPNSNFPKFVAYMLMSNSTILMAFYLCRTFGEIEVQVNALNVFLNDYVNILMHFLCELKCFQIFY